MATITRENLGTLHDKIKIELARYDYMPSYEKRLKEFAKTANVPGFRKGMVPAGVIKKMAGQNIFNEEVIKAAGNQLELYLRKEKLAIFGQPMILNDGPRAALDMNNPQDIDFAFEIGVKPDFDIPSLTHPARLTAYKIPVTDAMLNDELERLKRRFGTVSAQEKVLGNEDVLIGSMEPCDANGKLITGVKQDVTVVFNALPEKMQQLMMDKAAGSAVVVTPAEVCSAEELPRFAHDLLKTNPEEASAHYLFKLLKVGQLIPMDMGFELYEKVFPNDMITSETDFREKVRTEIQREYDRLGRERFHNEIFELLVHSTPIPLPVTFLKRWMKEGGEKQRTELEVDEEFGSFEHQLRWQLISEKIMQENRIHVTRDEVVKDLRTRVLAYYGMDSDEDAPWLAPYMEKVTKDEKTMDETYRRLLTDKIFMFLENQFNTELKEVDEATFFQLPHPHAAYHQHHDHH